MRQKEVLQKLSKEIRELHKIGVEKHTFHCHGNHSMYVAFPTSLIEKIEEDKITVDIRLRGGIHITLWKNHQTVHVTLFDMKAIKRKIAKERREGRKKELGNGGLTNSPVREGTKSKNRS